MAGLDKRFKCNVRPIAKKENVIYFKDYRVSVLFPSLFRIEKCKSKVFEDKPTQCIFYRDTDAVKFTAEVRSDNLYIITEKVTLVLCDEIQNSYVDFYDKKVCLDGKGNLLGTARTLDCMKGDINRYDGTRLEVEDGVCSRTGVALLDDSDSLVIKEDGSQGAREKEEKDIYVFAFNKDYKGAVKALYRICGSVPLFPRFALGNWWSRYHDYSDKEYLSLMDKFIDADIPFTVGTIDMDWHYSVTLAKDMKIEERGRSGDFYGGANGWTGYTWNKKLFPNYKEFLNKLKERNLKITLNLHPALGIRWFEECYEKMAKAMGVDSESGEQIAFDIGNPDFVNNYFDIVHRPYQEDGVDFYWIDWQQGKKSGIPGLDPLWALNHYHYLDNKDFNGEGKGLILSRYSGIGSHRYPLGFSGDATRDWASLDYIPKFTATSSNAGYGWWSHDIGGHDFGETNYELYVRYLQFGIFSPINRLHCSNARVLAKEPFNYKNGSGEIAKELLRLRHKMIPFLYSCVYRNNIDGEQLVEPLYYYDNSDKAYEFTNEYYFGGQLLVAPVTQPGGAKKIAVQKVYLPSGRWTDIFSGITYQGGRVIEVARFMDEMCIFLKEGGVFVLDDDKAKGNSVENPTKMKVYLATGNGSFDLYEDKDDKKWKTTFVLSENNGVQKVDINVCGESELMPKDREYKLIFSDLLNGLSKVKVDGKEIESDGYKNDNLTVKVCGKSAVVEIEFEREQKMEAIRRQIEKQMLSLEGFFVDMQPIFEEMNFAKDVKSLCKIIKSLKLCVGYKKKLLEIVRQ